MYTLFKRASYGLTLKGPRVPDAVFASAACPETMQDNI